MGPLSFFLATLPAIWKRGWSHTVSVCYSVWWGYQQHCNKCFKNRVPPSLQTAEHFASGQVLSTGLSHLLSLNSRIHTLHLALPLTLMETLFFSNKAESWNFCLLRAAGAGLMSSLVAGLEILPLLLGTCSVSTSPWGTACSHTDLQQLFGASLCIQRNHFGTASILSSCQQHPWASLDALLQRWSCWEFILHVGSNTRHLPPCSTCCGDYAHRTWKGARARREGRIKRTALLTWAQEAQIHTSALSVRAAAKTPMFFWETLRIGCLSEGSLSIKVCEFQHRTDRVSQRAERAVSCASHWLGHIRKWS